ncbi:MAG: PAS domain S-box protein [Thermovirgaceae bacterium]
MKKEEKFGENSRISCHNPCGAPGSSDGGEIKSAASRYLDLFDGLGLAVAIFEAVEDGKDFVFRDFNRAGEKVELIKREDIIGKSVQEVFPSIKECGLFDVFVRVWQTGIPERYSTAYYRDSYIESWRESYVYRLPFGEVAAIYDDVPEQKPVEEALRESERKLTTLISNLQGMVYSCHNDGNRTMHFVSEGAKELTGYGPEELVGNVVVSYGRIIHEEDRRYVWETVQKTLESKSTFTLEYRIATRGEPVKWVWERGQGVFSEKGKFICLEGFIMDITGMKEAKRILEEREERYRMISEMISDYAYSFRVEADGSLVREWVIGGFEKITGYTSEEVTRRGGWLSLMYRDDMAVVRKRSEKLLADLDDTSEFRIVRKDGEVRWLRDYARPVWSDSESRVVRIYGSVQDITERKKAEEEYRTLFRQMLDGFALHEIICDEKGNPKDYRFLAVNPAFEQMTGLKSEDIVGKTILQVLPETESFWIEKYGKVAMSGEPALFESYAKTLDRYYQVSAFRPEPGKFACIFTDITDRKRAEKRLRESEEKFRNLFDHSSDAIMIHDLKGRFLEVNDVACERLGYSRDELMGMSPMDIDAPEFAGKAPDRIKTIKQKGRLVFESAHLSKDGSSIPVEINSRIIRYEGKDAILSVARDVTSRKKSERDLRNTLERLRRVTGSVIDVIVSAVEARDPYTAGHQRRVGDLARGIATEMGLPAEDVEGVRIAGVIHDLGKISVPTEILSKPRKLSDMEFALVKEHPQKGYEILREVDFDWPVADMVRQHHERLDGSGYPQGLEGNEIVPGAKILAVADVVEAMASHRPYRPNLGLDAALKEIASGRGILYDSEAVDACLRLFNEKRYQLPAP